MGVQEPKPKQAPSGSHPAGAASSTPQLVYPTAPPVPGLSCRPKPGRGLAGLGFGVWGWSWSWSARIQTPLITRLVKLGRFSGPRNNSGSNSKASKFWPKDPGGLGGEKEQRPPRRRSTRGCKPGSCPLAPGTRVDRPARAWDLIELGWLGGTPGWLRWGGRRGPGLSPVGGLGPAAAPRTGSRRRS